MRISQLLTSSPYVVIFCLLYLPLHPCAICPFLSPNRSNSPFLPPLSYSISGSIFLHESNIERFNRLNEQQDKRIRKHRDWEGGKGKKGKVNTERRKGNERSNWHSKGQEIARPRRGSGGSGEILPGFTQSVSQIGKGKLVVKGADRRNTSQTTTTVCLNEHVNTFIFAVNRFPASQLNLNLAQQGLMQMSSRRKRRVLFSQQQVQMKFRYKLSRCKFHWFE